VNVGLEPKLWFESYLYIILIFLLFECWGWGYDDA
jgi:hypothetical protein